MSRDRQRVVRELVADVADARVRPGDALPSYHELARRFGVSPEVARAAVRQLEVRGVAEGLPDGRATVRPEARWHVLDPDLLDVLLSSRHGPAILLEYVEYRRVVEIAAAGRAAEHATAEDLAVLSGCLAEMTVAAEQAPTSPDAEASFHEADVEFHQTLIAAGRNRPLQQATDALRPALCTARRVLARPRLRVERALPEHQRIVAAVAQGDAEGARAAMTAHLDTVEAYLWEHIGLSGRTSEPSGGPDER